MITAWDGFVRVDYLPDPGQIQVTLLTTEPTVHRRLHAGLACSFVADDGSGPPVYVKLELLGGLTDDVRVLLGDRLAELVMPMVGTEPKTEAGRLDLVELEALAETWAPYRDQVLATEPDLKRATAGSWARDLWTRFGAPELRIAVTGLEERGHRSPPSEADALNWREFTLPDALAEAAGVEPAVGWIDYDEPGESGIVVRARALGETGEVQLLAGWDDSRGTWVPLVPDDSGWLLAFLPASAKSDAVALRFRTGTEVR